MHMQEELIQDPTRLVEITYLHFQIGTISTLVDIFEEVSNDTIAANNLYIDVGIIASNNKDVMRHHPAIVKLMTTDCDSAPIITPAKLMS